MRRLFIDIETSPNIGIFWRPGYNLNIGAENIIEERAIICASWKFEHSGEIVSMAWDAEKDDRKLVKRLAAVLSEADEVVAHNGDKFDLRWIRGRCLFHGIALTPFITTVDTYKVAKKYFELNSHRLDYIGRFLGLGGKRETGGLDLWKRVALNNDRSALADMVKYNRRDVELLESVYHRLEPYFPAKTRTSIAAKFRDCPACGSTAMTIAKRRTSAVGTKTVQLRCSKCGRFHSIAASKLFGNK